MEARWVIQLTDFDSYRKERLNRPSAKQIGHYYNGFNREKPVYEDELKDLEKVYTKGLKMISEEINEDTPRLLHYMKEFISLHEKGDEINEKLKNLKAKMKSQEGDEDE